jgi:hypothetical protein
MTHTHRLTHPRTHPPSNQPNVLCLPFELMKDDLKAVIPKAAEFMGVECDDALVQKVAELSDLEWMSANEDKFSEGWFYEEQLKYNRFDRPPLPPVAKVTKGSKVVPSEATVKLFEEKWSALVTPTTGCATYADMLAQVTTIRALALTTVTTAPVRVR